MCVLPLHSHIQPGDGQLNDACRQGEGGREDRDAPVLQEWKERTAPQAQSTTRYFYNYLPVVL